MSKVIRTGQVASGSGMVTLGRAEAGLYYEPEKETTDRNPLDLPAMLEARINALCSELDQQWEGKLRQEHETTRAAGEKQLQDATQQHQQELERVRQERYDEGHRDGVESKEAEAREAVVRMASLHDALKAERSQVLLDAESVVVDLAMSMARRVVRVEPVADARVVARIAREALRHLSDRSNLLLKVHSDDLGIARRFAAAWVDRVDKDAILRVQVSSHVDRGGCMIEGPEENVDARLSPQLETLYEALRQQVMELHADGSESPESQSDEDNVAATVSAPSEGDPDADDQGTIEESGEPV
ncbi:MAG TPA: FliH/SctL family protein [Candidatus Latescibacteria bacterium]|nr:FliH/SctL family protein [Candidatus Latescibacterota bacterium]HJN31238.1 FliH/SctL family protein [Candidatus Latescibacterota bacterium]